MITKICGIKNESTLLCCEKNNVDFFGMIFYTKSPRNITFEDAQNLQEISKTFKISGVGVFVNENINKLKENIKRINLKYVQLHGEENFEYIENIKKLEVKVIKKISIKNESDLKILNSFRNVDYYLFDYKPDKHELPGGNAKSFNWEIVKNLEIDKPWFLSGGINLDNIQKIKTDIMPYGVDLSSGVEKELGIKDNHIINNFIGKLNNA